MNNYLKNKKILITGGTGSIGSAVVKELLKCKCSTIRILGSDENGLHNLSLNLSIDSKENFFQLMKKNNVRFIYGDITDQNRLVTATEDIDFVIHAAAMKHVPICEYNPFEATKVNVLGTENLIRASIYNKVSKFILISTDKVVEPTTCLGTTKLLAEKLVINSNLNKGNKKINFSVVRFGNVIGTRGSVLPKFILQSKNNKTLTVTDIKSTRFFVSIKDAVNSILASLEIMLGGEVFIPRTIYSMKIYDLAFTVSKYFNKKPNINVIGLRGDEKVNEKILTEHELIKLKKHKDLYLIDNFNKHKFSKVRDMINYFCSDKAKILNSNEILTYLIKNNLL
jgi:UDP-N-acetylglucosamine 4,6-dehydratase